MRVFNVSKHFLNCITPVYSSTRAESWISPSFQNFSYLWVFSLFEKKARRSQLSGVDLKDYRISIQSLDRIIKNRSWKIEWKKHRKAMLLPIDCHPMHTAHYTFGDSLTNSSWWLEGWAAKLNILILPSFLMYPRHHHDIDRAWVLLKHTWI